MTVEPPPGAESAPAGGGDHGTLLRGTAANVVVGTGVIDKPG